MTKKKTINKKKFTVDEVTTTLESRGIDPSSIIEKRAKQKVNPISDFENERGRKRHRANMSDGEDDNDDDM
jgi:hypothetical protein